MMVRTLLRCSLGLIFLVGLGLAGCSDDVTRITTPATGANPNLLATGNDLPESGFDMDDNIPEGYYYPEEDAQDEVETGDSGNPEDRFDNDDPSTKPIDNGKSGS